jgi:hypothetical protein
MLDPIQYEFLFLFTTLADPEPEPKLRYSGSSQKFWLLAALAPQHLLNLLEGGKALWRPYSFTLTRYTVGQLFASRLGGHVPRMHPLLQLNRFS